MSDDSSWSVLRDHDPLRRDDRIPGVLVSRYEDVRRALSSTQLTAAEAQRDRRRAAGVPESLLTTDGPEHQRLRHGAMPLVATARLEALASPWRRAADSCIAGLVPGVVDLRDAAESWSATVLAELLEIDDAGARQTFAALARRTRICLDPVPRPAVAATAAQVNSLLAGWLRDHVERARGPVVRAVAAELGPQDTTTLLALCVVGGWAPLADLTLTVALQSVRPESPWPTGDRAQEEFTDEVLRLHTPVPHVVRRGTCPVQLPSGTVEADEMAILSLVSANRDDRAFDSAQEFRCPRPEESSGQLAFGRGPHFCLGAGVVRASVGIFTEALHQRWIAETACHETGFAQGFPRSPEHSTVRLRQR